MSQPKARRKLSELETLALRMALRDYAQAILIVRDQPSLNALDGKTVGTITKLLDLTEAPHA